MISENCRNYSGNSTIIGFYPGSGENAYQVQMQKVLNSAGEVVPVPRVKLLALGRLKRIDTPVDYMLVNWIENALVSRKSGRPKPLGMAEVRFKLGQLRSRAHHLILIRHNEFPHRTATQYQDHVRSQINELEREFDAVITHSGHNAGARHYIPHPLYHREGKQEKQLPLPHEHYCVAFGRIASYKQLTDLAKYWDTATPLIIAGPCKDSGYLKQLQIASADKNITIWPRFLSEPEAEELVSNATCLVMAHADQDMVVSGSYFFGISHDTATLAVKTPFFEWLKSIDAPGAYTVEHVSKLAKSAEKMAGSKTSTGLRQKAEPLFGEKVVLEHWRKLMKTIENQTVAQ